MVTRQKLRNLLRKKLKAEKALFKASQRINLRKGHTTDADQHILERSTADLNRIEEEVNQIEQELQGETNVT